MFVVKAILVVSAYVCALRRLSGGSMRHDTTFGGVDGRHADDRPLRHSRPCSLCPGEVRV